MSATAKLSSKLPGDEEINGLDALVPDLLASPTDIICVIGWVKVVKITQDVETGDEIPTLQLARVEPIGTVRAIPAQVVKLAAELYEKRTGRSPLPIDQVLPTDEIVHTSGGPSLIDED